MVFKFCVYCVEWRQFLPNDYSTEPRKCDVCNNQE